METVEGEQEERISTPEMDKVHRQLLGYLGHSDPDIADAFACAVQVGYKMEQDAHKAKRLLGDYILGEGEAQELIRLQSAARALLQSLTYLREAVQMNQEELEKAAMEDEAALRSAVEMLNRVQLALKLERGMI